MAKDLSLNINSAIKRVNCRIYMLCYDIHIELNQAGVLLISER